MLTPDLIKEINEFVYKQPRTITEVASIAKVSWLTADKYITYISEKYGTIKVKTFRGGTRGAVKIVYWSNFDSLVKPSTAQHILLEKIKYCCNQDKIMSINKDPYVRNPLAVGIFKKD